MADNGNNNGKGQSMADGIRSWVMVALTFIFVALYVSALVGWLKPLTDDKMLARLEPIIFVIIGYYFGRLPAQQNEKTLKQEIDRQTGKADQSQREKDQAERASSALQEKVKNAKAALGASAPAAAPAAMAETLGGGAGGASPEAVRYAAAAAYKVLES